MAALGALLFVLSIWTAEADPPPSRPSETCRGGQTAMARVDLFFGAERVGPAAWSRFLATIVTPRFPDGLTSLDGRGQWRGPRGLRVERSRVLVIYYRPASDADTKIEAIRAAYKRRFAQSSVLRADSSACVSF